MSAPDRQTHAQSTRDELAWRRQHAILHGQWEQAAHYATLLAASTPDHSAPVGPHCPYPYPIKARRANRCYYRPGRLRYDRTVPDPCFATEAAAQAAGYRRSGR